MRYKEWIDRGNAITVRSSNPYANSIIVPVTIMTKPSLCSERLIKTVKTHALVDTGATVSAIDAGLAEQLGLIPISKCMVNGVHGSEIVNMYSFDMVILDAMRIDIQQATSGQFKASSFKILLGMDILRLGEMYLGQEEKDGKCCGTIFSFSIPPTGNSIDFAEKLKKERRR